MRIVPIRSAWRGKNAQIRSAKRSYLSSVISCFNSPACSLPAPRSCRPIQLNPAQSRLIKADQGQTSNIRRRRNRFPLSSRGRVAVRTSVKPFARRSGSWGGPVARPTFGWGRACFEKTDGTIKSPDSPFGNPAKNPLNSQKSSLIKVNPSWSC